MQQQHYQATGQLSHKKFEVYQPRQPSLVCYLEPIGSGGDHWDCFRLSARSGHAQQQPPTHPRGVEL